MKNKEKLKLLTEVKRREKELLYKDSFREFAREQIKIITKDSSKGFINFKFNDAQNIINEKLESQLKDTGKVRAIILKARQQGISTYCSARVFWKSYYTSHTRSVVMAHDSPTSEALFTMSKNLIDNMTDETRPALYRSNAREIMFAHNNSGYRLYTAGSPEAGRGTTPTIAHLSEVAFWSYDEKILAGLFQGISQAPGTEVILESTANGASGEFYRLYQGAIRGENEYIPIFIPWFATPEYRREAPEKMELSVEEDKLIELHGLDKDQLYWRRLKIAESGAMKFKQEYPATADEAFLVSGSNVFNQEKVHALLPKKAISRKEFDINSSEFQEYREGSLETWKYSKFEDTFIIGADVAMGVGQDYSAAVVMNPSREIVALYRSNRIDPSAFGDVLFYLGRKYNNALVTVESNSIGIATLLRLKQMEYVNIYYQTKAANLSTEETLKPGFRITGASKPMVIANLKRAVDDDDLWIPSNVIIQEMKDYISKENGQTEALPGCHDDTIMALALCVETLRTHADRLSTTKVTWKNRSNLIVAETKWI